MRSGWVTRTYTYTEPVDDDTDTKPEYGANAERKSGVTGPDTYSDTFANRPEFNAGWSAGYRSGWITGAVATRHRDGEVEDAWAAGFIDGEGCLEIIKPRTSRSGSYMMRVTVSQKRREPLDRLSALYGGSIRKNKRGQFDWRITSSSAGTMIDRILPFMIEKREQALIAKEFQQTVAKKGTRPKGFSTGDLEIKERVKNEITRAKRD